MAKYKSVNVEKTYDDIYAQQKKANNKEYEKAKKNAEYEQEQIAREYDAEKADSYVKARLNAKNINEQMAAIGLQQGSGKATSGYSDSQRAAYDNAWRTDVNALSVREQQERDEITQQLIAAGYDRDAANAEALANIRLQQAQAKTDEDRYTRQTERAAEQTEYQKALARAEILGYVKTKEDAKILGVPVGTKIK